MTRDDVKAFATRDWTAVSDADALHWAAEFRERGSVVTVEASRALWEHARRIRPEWPTADGRRLGSGLRRAPSTETTPRPCRACLRTSVRYSPRSVPASTPWVFAGICSVRRRLQPRAWATMAMALAWTPRMPTGGSAAHGPDGVPVLAEARLQLRDPRLGGPPYGRPRSAPTA